jgi:hypothetical protein
MNCLDCAAHGQDEPAVAICLDCGAGLCLDHAEVEPRWLTRTAVINRVVTVEPPARVVRCRVCSQAQGAATRPARRQTSGRGLPT